MRVGEARISHGPVRRLRDLANLAHPADLLGWHRVRAGPAHDKALVSTGLWNLDPFARDHGDVRRDHPGAPAREHEDDLLRNVIHRYPDEPRRPLAQRHVRPDAAPVVVLAGPLGLSGDRD